MKNKKLRAFAAVFLILSLVFLAGLVNARVVRLKNITVPVQGLDGRLEGMTVAFISDLKIKTDLDARRSASLVKSLASSGADMLIIAGDLTDKSGDTVKTEKALKLFLDNTRALSCPAGMYIVYGDSDIFIPDSFAWTSAFTLVNGGQIRVKLNGASFVLVGYNGMSNATRAFTFTDEGTGLAIVVAHEPKISRMLPYITDALGRPYADLFLCGHTLGGQVNLLGKALLYPQENTEYPNETASSMTIPMVVSRGIGTEYVPFRLGSAPTAYMVKLTRG